MIKIMIIRLCWTCIDGMHRCIIMLENAKQNRSNRVHNPESRIEKKIKEIKTMTKEAQNKMLENKIRKLAPDAIDTMGELLRDQNTPAPTKAQLIGFVLERTLGKPDATIHLTTENGTQKDSENRLIALAQEIREETMMIPESGTAEEKDDDDDGEEHAIDEPDPDYGEADDDEGYDENDPEE